MLVASTEEEAVAVKDQQALLESGGLRAFSLTTTQARWMEPALRLPRRGGALLVHTDVQLVSECF